MDYYFFMNVILVIIKDFKEPLDDSKIQKLKDFICRHESQANKVCISFDLGFIKKNFYKVEFDLDDENMFTFIKNLNNFKITYQQMYEGK